MKSLLISTLAITAAASFIACSKDETTTTAAPTTEVSRALSLATTKISAAVPNTAGVSASSLQTRASFGTNWTDAQYALAGDWGNSPRNYIRNQGDKTAQSSLMYRFNQALENMCLFSTALPSTGGVANLQPTNTTVTLTAALIAEMKAVCGVAEDQLPPAGTVVGYVVEDISAGVGSNYERKISFDMDGGSSYTSFFYFTISTTVTRFMFNELSDNNSVAIFDYNSTTGIGRFEFSEKSTDGRALHYRVVLDETNDKGLYVAYAANSGMADLVKAVVGTVEGSGAEIAVSYLADMNGGGSDITDNNACISGTTLAIVTDGSLACAGGVTGAAVSGFTASMAGITSVYLSTNIDTTTFMNFTNTTDVLTAAIAN